MTTATIDVCGDILSVTWTGSVWRSPSTGSQHTREWDALAVEMRRHLGACGEETSHIDGEWVREHCDIERS